jgi:hypothetical protein
MDAMKKQALDKLMMVLDDILGEDVKGRMGKSESAMHETKEGPKAEKIEDVLEEVMGKESPGEHGKVASGGASIMALPEVEGESPSESKDKLPKGIGVQVEKLQVSAAPKPGMMRKMRGLKS